MLRCSGSLNLGHKAAGFSEFAHVHIIEQIFCPRTTIVLRDSVSGSSLSFLHEGAPGQISEHKSATADWLSREREETGSFLGPLGDFDECLSDAARVRRARSDSISGINSWISARRPEHGPASHNPRSFFQSSYTSSHSGADNLAKSPDTKDI